jgi:(p)ppGpp synthase/HD superfamily hydrolase
MDKKFEDKFSRAIDFLKKSDIFSPNKPVVPHDLRVGYSLYLKGFDEGVVAAGLLHDMLEWSSVKEQEIIDNFGENVLKLIKANSKNRSIIDSEERRMDIIARCKQIGDDALAIKIVDTLDSYDHYLPLKNEKGLQRCRTYAQLLLDNLSARLKELFYEDLKKVVE